MMRNRLFVFGGYEGTPGNAGRSAVCQRRSPIQRWLRGDFSDCSDDHSRPSHRAAVRRQHHSRKRASHSLPRSQIDKMPREHHGYDNNYRIVRDYPDNTDTFTLRLDQVLNPSQASFQRLSAYASDQILPGAFTIRAARSRAEFRRRAHLGGVADVVNETRFGYNYALPHAVNIIDGEDYLTRTG